MHDQLDMLCENQEDCLGPHGVEQELVCQQGLILCATAQRGAQTKAYGKNSSVPGDPYCDSGVGYFHLGGHLLADIIKATPFTEGYKMILKC